MNTLSYFLTYVGVGVIALVLCRIINWLKLRYRNRFVADLLASVAKPPSPFQLADTLKDIGSWLLALAIWPLAVLIVAGDWLSALRRGEIPHRELDPEARFYAKDNLTEIITIDEAESRERVSDPLGRVPAAPFGHLSAGWKSFLERQPSNKAELWAFDRKFDAKERWSFDRANGSGRGYCWVVDGRITTEIRTEGS
jgi:hypothetical protein